MKNGSGVMLSCGFCVRILPILFLTDILRPNNCTKNVGFNKYTYQPITTANRIACSHNLFFNWCQSPCATPNQSINSSNTGPTIAISLVPVENAARPKVLNKKRIFNNRFWTWQKRIKHRIVAKTNSVESPSSCPCITYVIVCVWTGCNKKSKLVSDAMEKALREKNALCL